MAPGRSLFSTLPAELYDNIFEESFRIDDLVSLQCMRLVSRHYARLPSLLRILFKQMVLPVSQESLADISHIAPHVKHVSFQPIEFSWTMDLDTYRQILFFEPMKDACHELNRDWSYKTRGRYINPGDVSPLTFVKYYMGDKPPYPEEEVISRYDEYMSQANKIQNLFENGEFARHWKQMMEQMTGEITVETRFWRFHNDHKHHYTWAEGDNAHTPEKCMEIHGTVGETLFDTVLRCLTEAKVRIRSLHIGHCVRSRSCESFSWVFDGRLDSIDLQGLVWNPCVPPHPEAVRPSEREWILSEVLNTLLSKSASKLRRVHLFECVTRCIYHNAPEGSHTTSIVKMPLVESFISQDEQFIGGLTNFFRESRHLKYIKLRYPVIKRRFHEESSWRRFWRAIRHHPSRMLLNLQYYAGGDQLRLLHDTGKDSKNKPGSVPYSLEMYLSNRGKWDTLCEEFFREDEDPDYENMGDTDDEEIEYWEGKNDNKNLGKIVEVRKDCHL